MKMLSSFCPRCKQFTFVWNIYFNIFKFCSFISKKQCEHCTVGRRAFRMHTWKKSGILKYSCYDHKYIIFSCSVLLVYFISQREGRCTAGGCSRVNFFILNVSVFEYKPMIPSGKVIAQYWKQEMMCVFHTGIWHFFCLESSL